MDDLKLVGLCGRRGAGKDIVAQVLVDEYSFVRMAFADRLKAVARSIFHLSREQVHGTLEQKEAIDPRWGLSPCDILQRLGTECARGIHPDVWVLSLFQEIEERMRGLPSFYLPLYVVVADVRFPNEAQAIRERGGLIVKVVRVGGPALSAEQAAHPSEASVDLIDQDLMIEVADGNLDALRAAAHTLGSKHGCRRRT